MGRQCRGTDGSSPLARGLRRRGPHRPGRPGIIPARAGFTCNVKRADGDARDHPRSRGVYGVRVMVLMVCLRIIPARAGFTPTGWRGPSPGGDHPRSRGVYDSWTIPARKYQGSSPLARGLRRLARDVDADDGIIPARAGFTRRRDPGPPRPRDHPRSRGVYGRGAAPPARRAGSSPLARGLQTSPATRAAIAGIISARAGFTPGRGAAALDWEDHPRSRGVYSRPSGTASWPPGSSPLARGLHCTGGDGGWQCRIIPARAGFTRSTVE